MHTQTIIQSNKEQSQIEPGTRKKKMLAQIKQGTRKSKEKKKLVRRPAKSMPLWSAEILPLLHQITKIDLGICFGFCVWFCSWVFGAGSEWELCGLQELVDFFFQRKKKRFKEEEEEDWFFGFWVCLHRWFLCFLGLSQHYQYMEFKF